MKPDKSLLLGMCIVLLTWKYEGPEIRRKVFLSHADYNILRRMLAGETEFPNAPEGTYTSPLGDTLSTPITTIRNIPYLQLVQRVGDVGVPK